MEKLINNKKKYNLEERTIVFSESVIDLCKKVNKNIITITIISQLIRSATSIGANYREANGASSKKDFKNKIFICKKECKETEYWFKLLAKSVNEEEYIITCRNLWKENHELLLIFSKIAFNTKI
jgi:four helix bundle protein